MALNQFSDMTDAERGKWIGGMDPKMAVAKPHDAQDTVTVDMPVPYGQTKGTATGANGTVVNATLATATVLGVASSLDYRPHCTPVKNQGMSIFVAFRLSAFTYTHTHIHTRTH